jgi:hypothetical protein
MEGDDRRDDRGRGQEKRQVHEITRESPTSRRPKTRRATSWRARRYARSQPEPSSNEEVEETRDDERGGVPITKRRKVLPVAPVMGREPRERKTSPAAKSRTASGETAARRVEEARRPLGHGAEILDTAA